MSVLRAASIKVTSLPTSDTVQHPSLKHQRARRDRPRSDLRIDLGCFDSTALKEAFALADSISKTLTAAKLTEARPGILQCIALASAAS